jgi:hypothetical protein
MYETQVLQGLSALDPMIANHGERVFARSLS